MNKSLLILSAVVALVVGYAVYDYQAEKKQEEVKTQQSQLSHLNSDVILEISIASDSSVKLLKEADGWKLLEPVKELADQTAVQDFLKSLGTEHSVDVAKEGAGIDWKLFGFDHPKGTITLKGANNQIETFIVSGKKNYSSDAYLKIEGQEKVYVVNASWMERAQKQAFAFRDKRLMRLPTTDVVSVQIRKKNETVALEKKNERWLSHLKPLWKLDQTRVQELVTMLNSTLATGFVEGKDALSSASTTVEVSFKDGKKWSAVFFQNVKKEPVVKVSEPALLLKIAPVDVEKFAKTTLESLRDRREPFDFKKDDVKSMELRLSGIKTELEFKDNKWQLQKQDPNWDLNENKAQSLISQLNNLEVSDFDAKKVSVSGGQQQEVILKNQEGKTVFQMIMGPAFKKKIGSVEKTLIPVKTSLSQDLVNLDEAAIKGLGLGDLLKKKEQKK